MLANPEIQLGNYVVLTHDPSRLKRMVVKIIYDIGGSIFFGLQCGSEYSEHYMQELEIIDDE